MTCTLLLRNVCININKWRSIENLLLAQHPVLTEDLFAQEKSFFEADLLTDIGDNTCQWLLKVWMIFELLVLLRVVISVLIYDIQKYLSQRIVLRMSDLVGWLPGLWSRSIGL